jgi:hypothetical protein
MPVTRSACGVHWSARFRVFGGRTSWASARVSGKCLRLTNSSESAIVGQLSRMCRWGGRSITSTAESGRRALRCRASRRSAGASVCTASRGPTAAASGIGPERAAGQANDTVTAPRGVLVLPREPGAVECYGATGLVERHDHFFCGARCGCRREGVLNVCERKPMADD